MWSGAGKHPLDVDVRENEEEEIEESRMDNSLRSFAIKRIREMGEHAEFGVAS